MWVPPGTFLMGTDETDPTGELAPPDWARLELASERPQHEVSLTGGYWIDKTEVTNQAFQAFVDAGGYTTEALWSVAGWTWLGGRDATALPVACVDAPRPDRVCASPGTRRRRMPGGGTARSRQRRSGSTRAAARRR